LNDTILVSGLIHSEKYEISLVETHDKEEIGASFGEPQSFAKVIYNATVGHDAPKTPAAPKESVKSLDGKLEWDPSKTSKNVKISDNGLSLHFLGSGTLVGSSIGSNRLSEYTIQIGRLQHGKIPELWIGFCGDHSTNDNSRCIFMPSCFFVKIGKDGSILNHDVIYNNANEYQSNLKRIVYDDCITAQKQGTTIRFLRNREDLGIVLKNVPEEDLFPFLEFKYSNYECYNPEKVKIRLRPGYRTSKWVDGLCYNVKSDYMVTQSGHDSFAVTGDSRVSMFTVRVKIISEGTILIGFHSNDSSAYQTRTKRMQTSDGTDIDLRSIVNISKSESNVCCLHLANGYICCQSGQRMSYTNPIKEGDIITVSKEGATISFLRNYIHLGVAISNAPPGDLFPFVEMNGGGSIESCENKSCSLKGFYYLRE
jgi:hypothetical protein